MSYHIRLEHHSSNFRSKLEAALEKGIVRENWDEQNLTVLFDNMIQWNTWTSRSRGLMHRRGSFKNENSILYKRGFGRKGL